MQLVFVVIAVFISKVTSESSFVRPYNITYCDCIENLHGTIAEYNATYVAYRDRMDAINQKVSAAIESRVRTIFKARNGCGKMYPKRLEDYVLGLFGMCSGIVLQKDLEPFQKLHSMRKEDSCGWIVSHGPKMYAETNHNHNAVEQCRNYEDLFVENYMTPFNDCLKKCSQ